jgi:hypothetical protein
MRVIVSIAIFLLTVFVGNSVLALSARTIVKHSQNRFVRMYECKEPSADILFFGDSRVDRNISYSKVRELTGKSCLNLGLGGNSVLVSEALLKDYVERYGNPSMVVIELSHTTVDPALLGEMRIFTYCSANLREIERKANPTFAAFENVFTSLRFNDPAFWRMAVEAVKPPSTRLLYNKIPEVLVKKWQGTNVTAGKRAIYRDNLEALGRICDFADARGIQLRLIISPAWHDFKRAIENFDEWKSALQQAAGKHLIHDYSDVFVTSPDYFNDEMHLNATGADALVEKLREDKVL